MTKHLLEKTKDNNLPFELKNLVDRWKNLSQKRKDYLDDSENLGSFNFVTLNSQNEKALIGYGSINSKPTLLVSQKGLKTSSENEMSIYMFGDDNDIDENNEIQSYNIKKIGYILYFVDCNSNRFRNSDVELLNTLRFGFKNYNSIFWNKLIIVMYNTNEICNVNLKYRPPKNNKDAKKEYDKNFVSLIEENFENTKKNIKQRIMAMAESINEACQENFSLNGNFSLEFIVMEKLFPFIDIPFGLNSIFA